VDHAGKLLAGQPFDLLPNKRSLTTDSNGWVYINPVAENGEIALTASDAIVPCGDGLVKVMREDIRVPNAVGVYWLAVNRRPGIYSTSYNTRSKAMAIRYAGGVWYRETSTAVANTVMKFGKDHDWYVIAKIEVTTTGVVASTTVMPYGHQIGDNIPPPRPEGVGGVSTFDPNAINFGVTGRSIGDGLNIFVVDRFTHELRTSAAYNIGSDAAQATAAAALLDALAGDVVVVAVVASAADSNRGANGLDDAMKRCGATDAQWTNESFSAADYILVGVPGIGEGNGYEKSAAASNNDTGARSSIDFVLNGPAISCLPRPHWNPTWPMPRAAGGTSVDSRTSRTQMEQGPDRVRRRRLDTLEKVTVAAEFTPEQFAEFDTWWRRLDDGIQKFDCAVPLPWPAYVQVSSAGARQVRQVDSGHILVTLELAIHEAP
jgi:hypothetical protein